jgi:hypothetical protein
MAAAENRPGSARLHALKWVRSVGRSRIGLPPSGENSPVSTAPCFACSLILPSFAGNRRSVKLNVLSIAERIS